LDLFRRAGALHCPGKQTTHRRRGKKAASLFASSKGDGIRTGIPLASQDAITD
jgi:hypothetical protein